MTSGWQRAAACTGRGALMFNPDSRLDRQRAALCASCPVLADCQAELRTFELVPADCHGWRAGRSEKDRRAALRGQGRQRPHFDREVARLTAQGYSARIIAAQLEVTKRTVVRARSRASARELLDPVAA